MANCVAGFTCATFVWRGVDRIRSRWSGVLEWQV